MRLLGMGIRCLVLRRARKCQPIRGPKKIPTLPVKAKKLKALACVLGVLISENIVRIVLERARSAAASEYHAEPQNISIQVFGNTHTTVPANMPPKHRKRIICQILLLRPNNAIETATPTREKTRTGFRPTLGWSARRPQGIMKII